MIRFTGELNDATLFFQDEINVGTGHLKFTYLIIVKYLYFFGCFSPQSVVLQVSFIAYHFDMLLQVFSPNFQIAVYKYLQATFSAYLGFLLKVEYVLTTDE